MHCSPYLHRKIKPENNFISIVKFKQITTNNKTYQTCAAVFEICNCHINHVFYVAQNQLNADNGSQWILSGSYCSIEVLLRKEFRESKGIVQVSSYIFGGKFFQRLLRAFSYKGRLDWASNCSKTRVNPVKVLSQAPKYRIFRFKTAIEFKFNGNFL